MTSTATRLERATAALVAYGWLVLGDDYWSEDIFADGYAWTTNDRENVWDTVTDLLTDLRHFCHAHDLDIDACLRRSGYHFGAERWESAR